MQRLGRGLLFKKNTSIAYHFMQPFTNLCNLCNVSTLFNTHAGIYYGNQHDKIVKRSDSHACRYNLATIGTTRNIVSLVQFPYLTTNFRLQKYCQILYLGQWWLHKQQQVSTSSETVHKITRNRSSLSSFRKSKGACSLTHSLPTILVPPMDALTTGTTSSSSTSNTLQKRTLAINIDRSQSQVTCPAVGATERNDSVCVGEPREDPDLARALKLEACSTRSAFASHPPGSETPCALRQFTVWSRPGLVFRLVPPHSSSVGNVLHAAALHRLIKPGRPGSSSGSVLNRGPRSRAATS
jgi:hypothetical protein